MLRIIDVSIVVTHHSNMSELPMNMRDDHYIYWGEWFDWLDKNWYRRNLHDVYLHILELGQ